MTAYEFTIDGVPSVEIKIPAGKIEVVHGQPGVVKVGISGSGEGDVVLAHTGSTVSIASKRQGRFIIIDKNIYATVEGPTGANVRANVASADLTCDSDLGHITFHSASGDLRFGNVVELEAKTASGDLRGRSVHERLNFVSASGDVYLGELHGRGEVSTASGDMHVDKVSGPIQVSTMSGDVHFGEFSGDEITCKSMSGNVRLGIPRGTRVDLDANSLSGKIRLPERKSTTDGTEMNSRSTRVQVRLVSGDLRIERA